MELSKEEADKLLPNLKDVTTIDMTHFTDLGSHRNLIYLNEDKTDIDNLIGWHQLKDGTLVLLKVSKETLKTFEAEPNKDIFRLEFGYKGRTGKGISYKAIRLTNEPEPEHYPEDNYNDSDDGYSDDPEITAYWDGSNG